MRRLFGSASRASADPGEFVVEPLRASVARYNGWPRPKLGALPLGQALDGRTDGELRAAGLTLARALVAAGTRGRSWAEVELVSQALSTIARRKLAWTPDEALAAVTEATRLGTSAYHLHLANFVITAIERAGGTADPDAVERYASQLSAGVPRSDAAKYLNRLRPFRPAVGGAVDLRVVSDGDGWGRHARAVLKRLDDPTGMDDLLHHLTTSATRPSQRWLTRTEQLLAAAPHAAATLRSIVAAITDFDLQRVPDPWSGPALFSGANADLARGAAFALALSDPSSAALLGDVAAFCGTTPGGSGIARDEKVANGCVAALGRIQTEDAIAALVRAKQKIKNRTIRKQIDRSLQEAADASGLGVDELVERGVPTHGLGQGGVGEMDIGGTAVRLEVDGDKVRLAVGAGRMVPDRASPAARRTRRGVGAVAARAKEATKTLGAERVRLESLLASERSWPLAEWARYYRDHPLTGAWTERLLWDVSEGNEGWRATRLDGGLFVDAHGHQVEAAPDANVRLWHPIRAHAADVERWRAVLGELELRQAFKQAWREVYLLTPAEEGTGSYSNRFAAHILRYPQAFALMKGRDWAAAALGYWDGGFDGSATRTFPGGTWRASFYYDLVERDGDAYGTPSLCSTDQVRFQALRGGLWETTPLAEVPPLVFSEAMRDVDLFVGVASIAADPTWVDRGDDRYLDYWQRTSFGDLTESAEARRAALERLMPRTKIADRCQVKGKYLVVRGDRRTYRIHIGSGNILMEPNDQYLCIVPSRDKHRDRIFLPFEEDGGRLSLIVSKAFLLADDRSITDTSILAQIARGT